MIPLNEVVAKDKIVDKTDIKKLYQ